MHRDTLKRLTVACNDQSWLSRNLGGLVDEHLDIVRIRAKVGDLGERRRGDGGEARGGGESRWRRPRRTSTEELEKREGDRAERVLERDHLGMDALARSSYCDSPPSYMRSNQLPGLA